MASVTILAERCKGCGICVEFCPKKVLGFDKEIINSKGYSPATAIQPALCVGCAACARMCPDCVITVDR
ncbi:MAG: 4Fe-4S binding protein [Oscillospiraceae bacterium]|jgi:2-oxoglutarate ferredoxin oxidoreductase subunit delta|nr:4Fe-4S binding protein [Oscillospiraceae bacterium]